MLGHLEEVLWQLDTIELDLGIASAIVETHLADDLRTLRGPLRETVRATQRWAAEIKVRSEFADCECRAWARSISQLSDHAAAEARRVTFQMSESIARSIPETRDQALTGLAEVRVAVDDVLNALG